MMVGKSRNTQRGQTRSTTGGAPGGGTVSGAVGKNVQDAGMPELDSETILDVAESAIPGNIPPDVQADSEDAEAATVDVGRVGDVVPDLTGRDTPGGRIADLAQGKLPQEFGKRGAGQGTRGNLGTKHGRKYTEDDIVSPGGGAAPTQPQKPAKK